MAKQLYEVEYGPAFWECTIVIDHTPDTEDAMKAMVEFWIDWESHLEANDGNYTKTFVQQLAREAYWIQAEHHVNLKGVIEQFKHREGWTQMDGSFGFTITYVDNFSVDQRDFQVKEGVPV